jgi:hypothetical protein
MRDTENSETLAAQAGISVTHDKYVEGAPMELLIRQWRATRADDVHRKVATRSAALSRLKYRVEREAEGKTVRPYTFHKHEPQQPSEIRQDYERRLRRDRARKTRGVDAETVRSWTDLSSMSPEEKLKHKRELANDRKAKSRERFVVPDENEMHAIEEALRNYGTEWGMF